MLELDGGTVNVNEFKYLRARGSVGVFVLCRNP